MSRIILKNIWNREKRKDKILKQDKDMATKTSFYSA